MPTSFSITAASTQLQLKGGEALAVFTVVNKLTRPARVRASVRTEQESSSEWIRIRGDVERLLEPDSVHRFEVVARPPDRAPSGDHTFWLHVQDVDDPDDTWDEGQRVRVNVPPRADAGATGRAPLPWWGLLAGAAGLVVVTALVVFLIARGSRPDPIGPQCCTDEHTQAHADVHDALTLAGPVGTVTAVFLNPAEIAALAPHWLPADGRMVTDRESPFINQRLPDLRDRVVLGTNPEVDVRVNDPSLEGGAKQRTASVELEVQNKGAPQRVSVCRAPDVVFDTNTDETQCGRAMVKGNTAAFETLPPFRRLVYIVRVR